MLTNSMVTCAAVALAAAVLTGRWSLLAFVGPLLGVLASVSWQRPPPNLTVSGSPELARCFEREPSGFTVRAEADDGSDVDLVVTGPDGLRLEETRRGRGWVDVVGYAERWGRYPIDVGVAATARGGLLAGTGSARAADAFVFPVAPPQQTPLPRTDLLDRLGTHLVRHVGRGVEYGNVRAYVPGDQLRSINWPVSARRGSLHVTERLSERAADVVVLVDTYDQPAGPATVATERTVRGAVQVVQSALRVGDRAGVVALGSRPRWLGADIGRRQFYRVLDAVLGAGDGYESTSGTLAPRAAVPPGAVVVAFSTLLDTDFALALIELCRRGHVVVAVDVLDGPPFADVQDPLIGRVWAMQRAFMYRDMGTIGVDVVAWSGGVGVDQVMTLVPDHRRARPGRKRASR